MAAYDSLLIDHDGVLVKFTAREKLSWAARQAFREMGVEDPDDDAVETLAISVSPAELHTVSDRYDLDPEQLWQNRDRYISEALLESTRNGGKEPFDDVRALSALDVPIGIVSNNQQRIVEFVMDYHDLSERFETIHARNPTIESLDRKKPAPTYLQWAIEEMGITNPLYVGDKETDIMAGQRAKLDVALIRRSHNADTVFDHEPTYDVDSLDEVVTILQNSR